MGGSLDLTAVAIAVKQPLPTDRPTDTQLTGRKRERGRYRERQEDTVLFATVCRQGETERPGEIDGLCPGEGGAGSQVDSHKGTAAAVDFGRQQYGSDGHALTS